MEVQALIDAVLVEASSIDQVELLQLQPLLSKYNVAVVRGLISPETIKKAKHRLQESFSMKGDNAATGEHPSEIRENYQKLSIGGAEHSGVYRPRCMRTFYNPIWAQDIYGMRAAFRTAAQLRNLVYGFDKDFAIDKVEEGFWTAARLHHYPAGGGFLVGHLDDIVPVVQAAEGINGYYQPIIVMSTCGSEPEDDFSTGGGFFEYEGQRYFFEQACQLGDVVLYSGATTHGVVDIDLHKAFRQDSLAGRLAGFVTIYREFTKTGELQDYIGDMNNK